MGVDRLVIRRFALLSLLISTAAFAQTVQITQKPSTLVFGNLFVPAQTHDPVVRVTLFINGVKFAEKPGGSVDFPVVVGDYIRRLRFRAVGYDAQGNVAGEDEMVVNDPRPPFRIRLHANKGQLEATVVKPQQLAVTSVDFLIGEEKIGRAAAPPYSAAFDPAKYPNAVYARVVAHASDGSEANDVLFFGTNPNEQVDVAVQQVPVSVVGSDRAPKAGELTLLDDGTPRKIEALTPASEQPLYVILLIDYSESMLDELPVVKMAARQFAQKLLRPQDRIAVVGFNQTTFWLTPFTNDFNAAAASVDRVKPSGETHLYDTAIELLYELQKQPGRHALVILTDGVDQGSHFKLDHLVHYARYAGVPVYPIIKNKMLTRLMRFGVGYVQARKLAAIAHDTGATYFIIKSERELPDVYAKLAQELRNQYQLAFYSDLSTPDQWHALRISSSAGQQLRIPLGYFP
ncbi:MAG: Ca-activated chloride channel [Thermoanaerobaculia bacterium]|jgi:Ca-activated chloride channel family protein|nr:Ca-activated chloride channel [Thermoanaerobaculia bacterium]